MPFTIAVPTMVPGLLAVLVDAHIQIKICLTCMSSVGSPTHPILGLFYAGSLGNSSGRISRQGTPPSSKQRAATTQNKEEMTTTEDDGRTTEREKRREEKRRQGRRSRREREEKGEK